MQSICSLSNIHMLRLDFVHIFFIASTVFLVKYKQIIISRRRVAEEKGGIINGYRSKQMLSIVLPATNKYCDTEKCRRSNARQNVIEPNGQ